MPEPTALVRVFYVSRLEQLQVADHLINLSSKDLDDGRRRQHVYEQVGLLSPADPAEEDSLPLLEALAVGLGAPLSAWRSRIPDQRVELTRETIDYLIQALTMPMSGARRLVLLPLHDRLADLKAGRYVVPPQAAPQDRAARPEGAPA